MINSMVDMDYMTIENIFLSKLLHLVHFQLCKTLIIIFYFE